MPVIIILFGIAIQVFLTIKKVSPFLSLLLVAIIIGLLLGMPAPALLASMEKGVGNTLGGLALVLSLGAILGKMLENSGAAEQITVTLIKTFGKKHIQWAVLLTGFLIGIPLFYNAGFIILLPLVLSIAKKTGLPLLYIVIPMAASLSTTHCFLPPHPGPVVLVNAFKANMGKTLLYGLCIAIPTVVISGPFLGRIIQRIVPSTDIILGENEAKLGRLLPAPITSFLVALLPVILITLSVAANHFLATENIIRKSLLFFGDSTIALLLAVVVAIYFLGIRKGKTMPEIMVWLANAVSGIALIMLIITTGGVLKQVLSDSGASAYITKFSSQWNISPLIFGWLVTALLRVTIGSATVAGLTAAGVVAPLVAAGLVSPELMVLAVGAGSVFGSHINDSGFWMFKEFFNLSMKQTFLSWTLMETVISLLGLAGVLILNSII